MMEICIEDLSFRQSSINYVNSDCEGNSNEHL